MAGYLPVVEGVTLNEYGYLPAKDSDGLLVASAFDAGLYVDGGALDSWSAARSKSTLSVFEDGVQAVMDTTSPCGPSLQINGLNIGSDYHIKFRFEQDSGSGYSVLRFDSDVNLYAGEFGDVSNPDIENIDVTLAATASTMYLGALRISHPAGGFIKISEISIKAV